jgi:hypothetical protein
MGVENYQNIIDVSIAENNLFVFKVAFQRMVLIEL